LTHALCVSEIKCPSSPAACGAAATDSGNNKAEGHTQDKPAAKVVTSAHSTIEPAPLAVKPELPPAVARPHVDFAFLRQQISLEQVLKHLDLLRHMRGSGPQRRGCCPVHSHPADQERTFSVHLAKNAFRCFQKNCGVQGNALDLWAAIHRLPLYDAALHLADTFGLPRNREEEPVKGTR
jgi:CHC2 zinc finger